MLIRPNKVRLRKRAMSGDQPRCLAQGHRRESPNPWCLSQSLLGRVAPLDPPRRRRRRRPGRTSRLSTSRAPCCRPDRPFPGSFLRDTTEKRDHWIESNADGRPRANRLACMCTRFYCYLISLSPLLYSIYSLSIITIRNRSRIPYHHYDFN